MKPSAKPFIYSSIIIVSILVIIFVAAFYSFSTRQEIKTSPVDGESCKTFLFNGGQYNLLFFANAATTKKYADYLLNFPPLNEKKEAFNIYYNDVYKANCENYKGVALLCYSRKLIEEASKCPSDYIIVPQAAPEEIRSSSYVNVMSINSIHPLSVVAHEFGHAFGFLAEEYVYENARLPRGAKNCVQECDSFDVSDGCFEGCSFVNYKRSVSGGVMRTLFADRFGIFNDNLIKSRIPAVSSSITGGAITEFESDCNQEYYLIEGVYDSEREQIVILDSSVERGCTGNGYGEFDYELYDNDGNILFKENFNPEFVFTDGQRDEDNEINGEVFASEKAFVLRIPAKVAAEKVAIIKEDNKKIEIEINDLRSKALTQDLAVLLGIETQKKVIVKNFEAGVSVETESVEGTDDPTISNGDGSGGESNSKGNTEGSPPSGGGVTGAFISLEKNIGRNSDYFALMIVIILVVAAFVLRKIFESKN